MGTVATENGGNGFKHTEGRFLLDIRKMFFRYEDHDIRMKLFTLRVAGHWNRLPREAVAAPWGFGQPGLAKLTLPMAWAS